MIAAMKKAHPEKSVRTLSYGVNGITSRNNVQRMVKLKYEQKGAPVYQYYFTDQRGVTHSFPGNTYTACSSTPI